MQDSRLPPSQARVFLAPLALLAVLTVCAAAQRGHRLNGDLALGAEAGSVEDFLVDSGEAWAVYRGQENALGLCELYSVPLDRSASAVKLNASIVGGAGVQADYAISPDGTTVVYRTDQNRTGSFELYAAPIDGSASAIRLSGRDGAPPNIHGYRITADGSAVVYYGDTGPARHGSTRARAYSAQFVT